MILSLNKVSKEEWKNISCLAHKISFNEEREIDTDRVDFVLAVTNETDLCGYATIIELDKHSVYMQHGGAFPPIAKTVYSLKTYLMFINWLRENYKSIATRVKNTNIPMIKLALSAGLIINGIDIDGEDVFLKFFWRRSDGLAFNN